LAQHGVHESCLAVVNMGDDGDITYRLGHRGAFPSSGLADGLWVGGQYSDQGSQSPFGALSTATIAAQCGNFYSISSGEHRF
jgi:hypothetical protein